MPGSGKEENRRGEGGGKSEGNESAVTALREISRASGNGPALVSISTVMGGAPEGVAKRRGRGSMKKERELISHQ